MVFSLSLSKALWSAVIALFLSTWVSESRDSIKKQIIQVLEKNWKGVNVFSQYTSPPLWIVEMCQRIENQNDEDQAKILEQVHQHHCQRWNSLNTLHIKLTEYLYKRISNLNQRANKTITPWNDIDVYKQSEFWTYPFAIQWEIKWDCEDYVIYKFLQLREMWIPLQSLKMLIVQDTNNSGHLVLGVFTNQGVLILDNQTNIIHALKNFEEFKNVTGYTLLKIWRGQSNWKKVWNYKTPWFSEETSSPKISDTDKKQLWKLISEVK